MNRIDNIITQHRAEKIMNDVAEHFSTSVSLILSPLRCRQLADARCVISYILYELEGCTFREIGRLLHRTHPAIIYHERKAVWWMRNPKINKEGAKAIRTIASKNGYYKN